MRTRVLIAVLAVTGAMGVLAATATASGPAAPGKDLVTISCDGLGPVQVSVQRGQNSNGAGQIVDAKGHGIPIEFGFTLTDLTTNQVIDSEPGTTHGSAHGNQTATHCSGVIFQGAASDIFGSQLPPSVAPTDIVQGFIDGEVVLKGI